MTASMRNDVSTLVVTKMLRAKCVPVHVIFSYMKQFHALGRELRWVFLFILFLVYIRMVRFGMLLLPLYQERRLCASAPCQGNFSTPVLIIIFRFIIYANIQKAGQSLLPLHSPQPQCLTDNIFEVISTSDWYS